MNNGTYQEALKAGFSEKKAGFLARLGAETKSEAVNCLVELQRRQKRAPVKVDYILAALTAPVIMSTYWLGGGEFERSEFFASAVLLSTIITGLFILAGKQTK